VSATVTAAPAPRIDRADAARILARYPQKRSAVLPLLHVAQERDGWITPEALAEVADLVGIPPVEVRDTASFYTMFKLEPVGWRVLSVCTNLPCMLRGAYEVLRQCERRLGTKAGVPNTDSVFVEEAECLAACHRATAVQVDYRFFNDVTAENLGQVLTRTKSGDLSVLESYGAVAAAEPAVLLKHYGVPNIASLSVYRSRGGYDGLTKAVKELTPAQVTEIVTKSGLRGRGGAGFPAGRKWSFIPKDGKQPVYLVANADEGDTGCFKDRLLCERLPHAVIEGCIIAAYAVGAHIGYIYLRGEFRDAAEVMERALDDCRAAGLLGENILGSGYDFELYIHRGAGSYVCGDETGLISSLEGYRGWPKRKPPYFPAVRGLYDCPTVVNNVETLACVPPILANGAEWFAAIGTEKSTGTRLHCVSGHVNRPGVYELPTGVPLSEIIEKWAGGMLDGRLFKAAFPGGPACPILTGDEYHIPMDWESLQAAGSVLGSGGIIVMDETTCMVRAAWRVLKFFAHESCGECTPCREGAPWLTEIFDRIEQGRGRMEDLDLVFSICDNIEGNTICAMGDFEAWSAASLVKRFRSEFEAHVTGAGCPFA